MERRTRFVVRALDPVGTGSGGRLVVDGACTAVRVRRDEVAGGPIWERPGRVSRRARGFEGERYSAGRRRLRSVVYVVDRRDACTCLIDSEGSRTVDRGRGAALVDGDGVGPEAGRVDQARGLVVVGLDGVRAGA